MNLLTITALSLLVLGTGWVGYKRLTRERSLQALVGKRVRLRYYDHNVHFEAILPRTGTVVSRHATEDVNDWFLLRLDEPFLYENREHGHLLIRSKWAGSVIGREEQVGVFVLLIPDMALLKERKIEVEKFEHVVWGFAEVIRE